MFQNNTNNNDAVGVANNMPIDGAQQQQQQQPQNINYNGVQANQNQQNQNKGVRKKPYVKITEQPASKALRFRYECEGRSAGSIPGVNSTAENKTYPTIEIVGYKGRAVVVVSCVTKDQPYRPHPHNLVGKEGCKKGVCTLEINSETMRAVFSNLGIQCVKKKDIDSALKAREDIRVDPFKTGFSHRFQPSSIDLNVVRLCFQVFMESEQKGRFTQPLPPVVSDPIYDKKAMSDLVICRLCSCSGTVLGNSQIILLCEKVAKEDIAIRFFEEKNNQVIWEAFGEFQHTDVHKQTAITFKTPRYRTLEITEPAKVFLQLRRPSDGVTSEALPFEYIPLDSGRQTFWNLRRNLKRKPDLELFQQILNVDSERVIEEPILVNHIVTDLDAPSIQAETITTTTTPKTATSVEFLNSTDVIMETVHNNNNDISEKTMKSTSQQELDNILNEKVRELELQQMQEITQQDIIMEIQTEQQQQQQQPEQQQKQQLEPLEFPAQICTTDKIHEWMKYNEKQTKETTENESNLINDDKTLNELLEQVVELDEIYSDHVHRRNSNELPANDYAINKAIETLENHNNNNNASLDRGESFDDAATYTSLQIAFKHPISIPTDSIMLSQMQNSQCNFSHTDLGTQQKQQLQQQQQRYIEQQQQFIHNDNIMHVKNNYLEQQSQQQGHDLVDSKSDDKKLPPLPPKRMRKPDSNNMENLSQEFNANEQHKQQETTIIIMKTPDQGTSPRGSKTKINTLDNSNPSVACKQKKSGFFSKIFSRRKSKPDLNQDDVKNNSKPRSSYDTREPTIQHFPLNDIHRSSMRASVKSLQVNSLPTSPNKVNSKSSKSKNSKPVGRSVSSVSGKRPAHLNADVIHIPLKGDSVSSLSQNNNNNNSEAYSHASTITLDRRTVSALQLADIPINDGNMELVAIADRQSLRNLCDGEANIQLDPNVDLTEAEHFALYTSIPPQATASEFDENSAYYVSVDANEILTPNEIAKRLSAANRAK